MTTKKDQAQAMLSAIETGNTDAILANVSPTKYIQHNLQFGNGRDAILASIPELQAYHPQLEFLRIIEDGDYVAVHTHYTFSDQPVTGFDIFRFENGKIVEHWDNLEAVTGATPSKHTAFDGPQQLTAAAVTTATKQLASAFQTDILINHQLDKLPQYVSSTLISHLPELADGAIAYTDFLNDTGNYQTAHLTVVENDFALLTSSGNENGQDVVYYDLIRTADNRIVELWRAKEIVLPVDQQANTNGKF
ncbi:nuclear transport factor 2 family protein [Furfurilactobacillus siliginis]|uniref:Polyketide cyclase n=1 Tax=Furfurilactobacillus siliginis TaxID=348151 RepID=A0A0R2L6L9_9LACO|nr:nuclear transport factor 2 family protein [Furfurilactobacillus siliginis]KRN97315.1 hypothetical protein IV55_GL000243 [Furfurilactobacillus siliginis]GEK28626.1 polyketide cyclase [Furfurilactobacillus siliginis]